MGFARVVHKHQLHFPSLVENPRGLVWSRKRAHHQVYVTVKTRGWQKIQRNINCPPTEHSAISQPEMKGQLSNQPPNCSGFAVCSVKFKQWVSERDSSIAVNSTPSAGCI